MGSSLELTGQRFGRLVALEFVSTDRHHRRMWRCSCDCGGHHIVSANTLRSGDSKSCGCLSTGPARFEHGVAERKAVLCTSRASARDRGYAWNLTDELVFSLLEQNCHWCGAPPSNEKRLYQRRRERRLGVQPKTYLYNGIDRVDNARGYEPDNVVACCAICNWMKRHLSVDTFIKHVERIYLHNKG